MTLVFQTFFEINKLPENNDIVGKHKLDSLSFRYLFVFLTLLSLLQKIARYSSCFVMLQNIF